VAYWFATELRISRTGQHRCQLAAVLIAEWYRTQGRCQRRDRQSNLITNCVARMIKATVVGVINEIWPMGLMFLACFIDQDGLFNGDRMAKLSLMARLYWTYFFAGANAYGRIEINYLRLAAKMFSRFPVIPSEAEVMSYLKEYSEAYL
jgi:hypothetical protein